MTVTTGVTGEAIVSGSALTTAGGLATAIGPGTSDAADSIGLTGASDESDCAAPSVASADVGVAPTTVVAVVGDCAGESVFSGNLNPLG